MTNFEVLISETAVKQLTGLDKDMQTRIKAHFLALKTDPFKNRSGADIKKLKGFNPAIYRLRVGDYRLVYVVDKTAVKITELFRRGKGYSWLD